MKSSPSPASIWLANTRNASARQLRRYVRSVAIDEYARQLWNFGDPVTVGFLLKLDRLG